MLGFRQRMIMMIQRNLDDVKGQSEIKNRHNDVVVQLTEDLTEALSNILLGEKIPLDAVNGENGDILIPANRKSPNFTEKASCSLSACRNRSKPN